MTPKELFVMLFPKTAFLSISLLSLCLLLNYLMLHRPKKRLGTVKQLDAITIYAL